MNPHIFNGTLMPSDQLSVVGEWDIKVVRADGRIERRTVRNVVTRAGLNRIANRAVLGTTTPLYVICVGTATAAQSLESGQAQLGEVLRKTAATVSNSREFIFLQCTIGGAADGVTSVALETGGIADHPNSHASTGIIANLVTGLGTTLANSDLVDITVRIRVGSHNLSHST